MKTKLIIISILLIAVGFITGCVAVGLSGGGFVLDSDETLNTYTVEEAFESISLTDETGDILVKTSEDGICRLECLESKRFQYEIKVEGGTLSVKRVENYLRVSNEELKIFARITGHSDVHDLNINDLCTINSEISDYTDIRHV